MNRCSICGRKLKNSETTYGVEFCKFCEKYEEQLTEKDKEIECIRKLLEAYKKQCHIFLDNELQIRKQVCDEIRKKAFRDCIGLNKDGSNFYHYVIRPDILDQIEKGETK